MIDRVRQDLRKTVKHHAGVDAKLAGSLLYHRTHASVLERLAELIARHRLVCARTNPRLHGTAQPMLLQHAGQTLHATGLLQQLARHTDQRTRTTSLLSLPSKQTIEE
ncbi:hypothetical protein GCM10027065_19170 [Rhodanobacter koreensis]